MLIDRTVYNWDDTRIFSNKFICILMLGGGSHAARRLHGQPSYLSDTILLLVKYKWRLMTSFQI